VQAANIQEALEAGAASLLVDEDTSATNFMIRDARMQVGWNRGDSAALLHRAVQHSMRVEQEAVHIAPLLIKDLLTLAAVPLLAVGRACCLWNPSPSPC